MNECTNIATEEMYRVLSRQTQKVIISQAIENKIKTGVNPNEMEPLFSQCIDYVMFGEVFPLVFDLYKKEFTANSEKVNVKYKELANCTPRHLEISEEYCLDGNGKTAEENYALAISNLRKISECNSLIEGKMSVLMNTSKAIVECVKNYHGKEKDVSADALMPIFIFVVIKAAIPDLYCQFKVLEDFVHESVMMGPMGYSLVTLQIAIDYMQTLNWEQLDQSFQIQMELKRQQEEFQQQRNRDIQMRMMRGYSVMLNKPPDAAQGSPENKYIEEHLDIVTPTANTILSDTKISDRSLSVFNSRPIVSDSTTDDEDESPRKQPIIPQTPDREFEDDVFSIVDSSAEEPETLRARGSESITLTPHQAVELSVTLLTKIIEVFNSSETISQTRKCSSQRFGWGKQLKLGKEFITFSASEMLVNEFTNLTYRLENIDLMELKKQKHLLTIFLINLYHIMLLHGFIKNGSYPLLSTVSRKKFMRDPMYVVGTVTLSLDDILCLLTSIREVSNKVKHELLADMYQKDPLNVFALSDCCFSSPPVRIYYPTSPDLVKVQLNQQATSFLSQTACFLPNTKVFTLPALLKNHLSLFGDHKETLINWVINKLPKDSEMRKDISFIMTYANIHIRFAPYEYGFQFKVTQNE